MQYERTPAWKTILEIAAVIVGAAYATIAYSQWVQMRRELRPNRSTDRIQARLEL